MLAKLDIQGNPYVGVYCRASDRLVLVPPKVPPDARGVLSGSLDAEVVETTLGGGTILGSLSAMNSKGLVTVEFALSDELARIEKHVAVARLSDKHNAAGNNILANDNAALVNPDLSDASLEVVKKTLGVAKMERGTIAGLRTVGAAAVATNKGVLCHPHATAQEIAVLKNLFGVVVAIGTVNFGSPLIGAGVVANTRGAIVGSKSTGIELGRVTAALGFL